MAKASKTPITDEKFEQGVQAILGLMVRRPMVPIALRQADWSRAEVEDHQEAVLKAAVERFASTSE